MRLNGKLVLTLCAGVSTLAGVLTAAAPSAAAPSILAGPLVPLTASTAPQLPAGAERLGLVAPGSAMHLDVTLNMRDLAGLETLANGLADRNSPYFHDFLTPAQIGALYGPTLAQVAGVTSALRAAGLSTGAVAANRLSIPVTATAAQVERAFDVTLVRYRMPGGRVAYENTTAPRLPASIAPLVSGVLGLEDLYQAHDMAQHETALVSPAAKTSPNVPATAGPQPCLAAGDQAAAHGSYTSNQIALTYGLSSLYQLGDYGQGVRVAVAEFEPNRANDITVYEQCYGIHTPVRWTSIDGGVSTGTGDGEASLDIEQIASLAPEIAIDVYQAPNSDKDFFDVFNTFVSSADKVLSVSWGDCESHYTTADLTDYATAILQANVADKTVVVASGDSGSTDCYPVDSTHAATLAVEAPASSPYALAVGATMISSDAPLDPETVYNEDVIPTNGGGASGGGISDDWCMPKYAYQPAISGLVNNYSETNTACKGTTAGKNPGGLVRQLPDISANGDPYSGYVIYFNGTWEGGWGGTSASTAVLAAIAALIDASPFCKDFHSGSAGLLPQDLYGLAKTDKAYIYGVSPQQQHEILDDVTTGTNDYAYYGYTAGLYPATPGYDLATGLGVPLVGGLNSLNEPSTYYPGLAAGMCWALGTNNGTKAFLPKVTAVTPDSGPAGHSIVVKVRGTGFLPIPGADLAKIFTNIKSKAYVVTANCTSATLCYVTLPALSARTVDVQISAEDFAYSAFTKADRFTYVKAKK